MKTSPHIHRKPTGADYIGKTEEETFQSKQVLAKNKTIQGISVNSNTSTYGGTIFDKGSVLVQLSEIVTGAKETLPPCISKGYLISY